MVIENQTRLDYNNKNIIVHRLPEENLNGRTKLLNDCVAYQRTVSYRRQGDYEMKMILDLDWDVWGSAAKAKTKVYKKKRRLFGGTKWKRYWTGMGARVRLQDYNNSDHDCNKERIHESGWKNRGWAYYVSVHLYNPGAPGFRVKPYEFWGWYKCDKIDGTHMMLYQG